MPTCIASRNSRLDRIRIKAPLLLAGADTRPEGTILREADVVVGDEIDPGRPNVTADRHDAPTRWRCWQCTDTRHQTMHMSVVAPRLLRNEA